MRLGRLMTVAAVAGAAGLTACGVPGQAPSAPGSAPATASPTPSPTSAATGASTVYVVGYMSGTVTPIDTATNTAGQAIKVGPQPIAIAVTPDGQTAYVVSQNGYGAGQDVPDGTVTPITTATNTPGKPITVGKYPAAIAITPDGKTAYVANQDDDTVTPITTATNTPGKPINVGALPTAIAITPDGRTAYVVSYGFGQGTVTPINTATNAPGPPINVGFDPQAVVITPDGRTAYVLNAGGYTGTLSGQVYEAGSITPISTATNRPGRTIEIGGSPTLVAMAISPNGQTAYVLAHPPEKFTPPEPEGDGFVVPVATATDQPAKPVSVGELASGLAITPDGKTLYIADSKSNEVTPIATATSTAGQPISTGDAGPVAVVAGPGGQTVYAVGESGEALNGSVTPIATATNQQGSPIGVGASPKAIVITPSGSTPYLDTIATNVVPQGFLVFAQVCPLTRGAPQPCPSSAGPLTCMPGGTPQSACPSPGS